jgi:hypothetical protein
MHCKNELRIMMYKLVWNTGSERIMQHVEECRELREKTESKRACKQNLKVLI